MASETPPASNWKQRFGPVILKLAALVAAAVLGALGTWLGVPPQVVETVRDVVIQGESPEGYAPTTGWFRDQDAIDENLDPLRTTQFDATPAGRAVMAADEDVYLWRVVRKAAGRDPLGSWYPNIDQKNVGCCVGAANKHVVDVLGGAQIVMSNRPGEWKPIAVEPSYALSRVEIGGKRISGDGSVGAWIVRADKEYGVVPMEKVGSHDLTVFSPERARSWGRTGCPDDLEPAAREHPVKGVALVKTAADVERAIRQGYPVLVCSDQGFRMERDGTGRCSPQGTWYHAMSIIGVRTLNGKTQFFVLNSWGNNAHTGPVVPADAPPAGFWADAAVIDRMVRQGDSFAISDLNGFPARKPQNDWFIRAEPRRVRDPFAGRLTINAREDVTPCLAN